MRGIVRGFIVTFLLGLGLAAWSNPSVVWVDAQWTGAGDCGGHTWQTDAFNTIQDGVDNVDIYGVVWVALGTYEESVTLPNPVLLLGPGAKLDPNDPTQLLPTDIEYMFAQGLPVLTPPPLIMNSDIIISGIRMEGELDLEQGTLPEFLEGMEGLLEEENEPPTAVNDSYTDLTEDTLYIKSAPGVCANDLDDGLPDGMKFSILISGPSHGTLVFWGSQGGFQYDPDDDYTGQDSLTYKVGDGEYQSANTATVSLTIGAVNDPPVNTAVPVISGTVQVGQQLSASSGAWNDDKDNPNPGTPLSYGYRWRRATSTGGPWSDITGATSSTYTLTGSDAGKYVLVHVTATDCGTPTPGQSATADSSYVTVPAENHPPVIAQGASVSTSMDEDGTFTPPTITASDQDNDTLTWSKTSGPSHGSAGVTGTGTSPTVTYTPTANYFGTDSFVAQVSDGHEDGTDSITIYITIISVNDLPVAMPDEYYAFMNTTLTVSDPGVLDNDTDIESDPLTASLLTGPSHAAVSGFNLNSNGSFSYTPATDYFGFDSFVYTASDGHVGGTDTAGVSLYVVGIDLSVGTVADADEETIGVSVSVNDDNDEGNTASGLPVADNGVGDQGDRIKLSPADHDLCPVTVTVKGVAGASGTVSITVNPGSSKVKLWSDATTLFTDTPVELTGSTEVLELWLEGIAASASVRDITITAKFTPDGQSSYASDAAKATVYAADADVDTADDSGWTAPVQGSQQEDWNEDCAGYGKPLSLNDDDDDDDDIVDTEDTQTDDEQFAPLVLTFPAPLNPSSYRVQLTYDDTVMRLWTKGRETTRNSAAVTGGGDRVPSATALTAAQLGVTGGAVTLYVEGLALPETEAERRIVLEVDPHGSEPFTPLCHDAARVIPLEVYAEDDYVEVQEEYEEYPLDVVANDDVLPENSYVTEPTITGVSLPLHGEAAVDEVNNRVVYTPVSTFFGQDVFNYFVSDGHGGAARATVWITVINTNDAPTAYDMTVIRYEDIPTSIYLLAYDPDGDELTYHVNSQPSHGVLSGTGATLSYTPSSNYFGLDSFTYYVDDGVLSSSVATVTVSINSLDDPPRAFDDHANATEDTTSVSVLVLGNDDCLPDTGETLTVTEVSQPYNGTVELIGGGVYYTPAADYFGDDWFTYTISDGNEGTSTALVSVSVTNVNDAPTAVDDSVEVYEDQVTDIDVLYNDTDPDNDVQPGTDTLTITNVTSPSHGTAAKVTVEGVDYVRYTPAANFFGTDNFSYTMSDGQYSDTAAVTVTVLGLMETVNAVDDYVSTAEDTASVFLVLDNDWPEPLADLTIVATTPPSHGAIEVVHQPGQADTIRYTPQANYFGGDSFTYTIQDHLGETDAATVYITVESVNDPPSAEEFYIQTWLNTPVNSINMLAHASGAPETGETLALAAQPNGVTDPPHGATSRVNGSTASYTPDTAYLGTDSFNYTVEDGNGGSATSTVWAFVEDSSNTSPVAAADAFAVDEDSGETQLDLLDNDSDDDEDPLTIVFFPTKPEHGTVYTDGDYAYYTPADDFFGEDSFTYLITDGQGGVAQAAVAITVSVVADSVDAVDDSVYLIEDIASQPIQVMSNDLNPDNLTLVVAVTSGPTHGSTSVTDNVVYYTPTGNYFGSDSFTYALKQGETALDTATVSITILGLNNAPDAADDYRDDIAEDSAGQAITVLANDTDPENDSLTVIAVTQPLYGEVTFTSSQVTYIPAEGYFGADEFNYTIQDPDGLTDTASVFVTVDNIDDSVLAYDDWAYAPMNGTGHLIDVLANDDDPDGDTLNITLPGQGQGGYPAHGAITVVTGSPEKVRYTPAAEYFGYDEFTYTVDDGHGNSDTATVSVIVYQLTVNVSPGYCVPGVSPARWAVPVGDQYYGTVVTLVVDTLPESIPLDEMSIAWTGADVDPDYSVYAYHDRTVTGAYNVEVQVTDADDESTGAEAELVVVGIDRIVSDDANLLEAETGNSENAVTGVSSDPASVTVKALVTPSTPDVSAVYNKLIVWGGSRGSVGITPDRYGLPRDYPARLPVQARIGASSDSLDVWAVRVNIRVGGLSEELEELDANAVSVSVNSDDNNQSGVPDVYESNDVLGLGVAGEDDLVPVGIGLEPNGVPVGELALVLPSGDHFAACANDDKAGGRLNPSSWSLDAGQPPYGVYLEGVSLTGAQSLLLQYSLYTTLLSEDSAKVKCVEHPDTTGGGASGAFFKMYSTRPIGGGGGAGAQSMSGGVGAQSMSAGGPHSQSLRPVTCGDAVGGDVTVAFVVSLPKHSYVMADAASLLYQDDAYPDEVNSINLGVYFTQGGWAVYDRLIPPDEWEPFIDGNGKTSIGSPIHEPEYELRDYPIVVATTQTINTRVFPWSLVQGTNGPHSLRLHKLWFDTDPENEFDADPFPINENGYLTEYDVKPLPYQVSNLTIKDVQAEKSAKPEDYFKYDPNPDSQYHRPVIHCTVEDEGDPHEYDVYFIVRPTGAYGWLKPNKDYPESYGWDVKTITGPGDVTFTWDGSTYPRGVPDRADWGTYTYEVFAYEYKTGEVYFDNWDDWFYYKWPYCLSDGGHDVWVDSPDDSPYPESLRCNYQLNDYAFEETPSIFQQPSDIIMIAVDNELDERNFVSGESEIHHFYNGVDENGDEEADGIHMYDFPNYIDADDWRVVFTCIDRCWTFYRRDHQYSVMISYNQDIPAKPEGPIGVPTNGEYIYYTPKTLLNRYSAIDWRVKNGIISNSTEKNATVQWTNGMKWGRLEWQSAKTQRWSNTLWVGIWDIVVTPITLSNNAKVHAATDSHGNVLYNEYENKPDGLFAVDSGNDFSPYPIEFRCRVDAYGPKGDKDGLGSIKVGYIQNCDFKDYRVLYNGGGTRIHPLMTKGNLLDVSRISPTKTPWGYDGTREGFVFTSQFTPIGLSGRGYVKELGCFDKPSSFYPTFKGLNTARQTKYDVKFRTWVAAATCEQQTNPGHFTPLIELHWRLNMNGILTQPKWNSDKNAGIMIEPVGWKTATTTPNYNRPTGIEISETTQWNP